MPIKRKRQGHLFSYLQAKTNLRNSQNDLGDRKPPQKKGCYETVS